MVTLCWAVKGGSGATVVASALALASLRPSLLVDLDGEAPAVLGLPAPDRPGVADWLASDASTDRLADLLVDVAPRAWLLPWRADADTDRASSHGARAVDERRWSALADWLHDWSDQWGCDVTVDVGTRLPPPPLHERARQSLLVTRACYLSLRRAVRAPVRPTAVVLVREPGRALGRRDVEHALGVPVTAEIDLDPAVGRAVDAGLLTTRLPRPIDRTLRRAAA